MVSRSYRLTLPSGIIYHFDTDGRLTKITDKNQRAVVLTYQTDKNNSRQLTITEETTGQQLYLYYNENNCLTKVSDKAGRTTSFTYENQCLTAITNPMGETTSYTYDEKGRILTKTNGAGTVKVTIYGLRQMVIISLQV